MTSDRARWILVPGVAAILLVPTFAFVRAGLIEGGFDVLFETEIDSVAVPHDADERWICARHETAGWAYQPGIETTTLGTRFVRLARLRLSAYWPFGLLGLRPRLGD